MFPPNSSAPPPPAAPMSAQPGAAGPAAGDQAIRAFRKALGLPENQPAPEQAVIDACTGKLGHELQRMAAAVGGDRNIPRNPAMGEAANPPVTPDPGQAGGEPAPPNPNGAPTGEAPSVQPGAATDGRMGSAQIFGNRPTDSIGKQAAGAGGPEDDEEDAPVSSRSMFGRR